MTTEITTQTTQARQKVLLPRSADTILETLETWNGETKLGRLPSVIDDKLKQAAADTRLALKSVLTAERNDKWIRERIGLLLMHWYSKKTHSEVVRMLGDDWVNVLRDYPQWAIEAAILDHNKTNEYKPVPANICRGSENAMKKYFALDMQCKRINNAENTGPVVDDNAASKARVAELMKETMAKLQSAKTYTKGKDNGHEKLN